MEDQVTSGPSAVVVRVRHGDEGDVAVQVRDNLTGARGGIIFDGDIELPSGVLKVSDALGDTAVEVSAAPGRCPIRIFADAAVEASHVDVVLGARDG